MKGRIHKIIELFTDIGYKIFGGEDDRYLSPNIFDESKNVCSHCGLEVKGHTSDV